MSRMPAIPMPKAIYVATSSVHGKGVFAARPLKKGEMVGRYETRKTKLTAEENPYVVEIYDDKGNLSEHRIGINDFKYINHSTKANTDMVGDDLQMIALRDIDEDEELTWYYGDEFDADFR